MSKLSQLRPLAALLLLLVEGLVWLLRWWLDALQFLALAIAFLCLNRDLLWADDEDPEATAARDGRD